jgi:hypothetical protein
MRMKASIAIIDAVAIVAWGSVVWLFCASFYFQFKNGYLSEHPSVSITPSTALALSLWIGVPFMAFAASIVLPLWLSSRGRPAAAESVAIGLCVLGVPWALLQWIGLGAG